MSLENISEIEKLRQQVQKCTKCKLSKSEAMCLPPVMSVGNSNSQIMLVGEALGENEVLMQEPFVGLAGQLLTKTLSETKIGRENCYICNTCNCRPTIKTGKFFKNRPPTDEEIQSCKVWLWKQIVLVKPKIIVTLGKVPTRLLLKLNQTFKIGDYVGQAYRVDYLPGLVYPNYHPSYILQNGKSKLTEFKQVFKEIKQWTIEN